MDESWRLLENDSLRKEQSKKPGLPSLRSSECRAQLSRVASFGGAVWYQLSTIPLASATLIRKIH